MDQIKIGKFIAECRKKVNLTQAKLAETLGVTDRAVSKWETGKSMPDSSIMLELCKTLEISVTELLKGERISMEQNERNLEELVLETVKQKERADRRLLRTEFAITSVCIFFILALCAIASFADIEDWLRITLIVIGVAPVIILTPFMIKIEQTAGYYECAKCGNKHVPAYMSVFFSMHLHTTRYLKCPKCGKKSWQKKIIEKE